MDLIIPALISGAVALLVAVAGFLTGRRKNEADAADVLTKIALSLVRPLEERVAEVEADNHQLHQTVNLMERENAALRRWSQILTAQVIENGGVPLPFDAVTMLEAST